MKTIIVAMILLCACRVRRRPHPRSRRQATSRAASSMRRRPRCPALRLPRRTTQTGFTRSEVTDAEGLYRLNALPVGNYDVHAELAGFTPYDRKAVVVNVGQTHRRRTSS